MFLVFALSRYRELEYVHARRKSNFSQICTEFVQSTSMIRVLFGTSSRLIDVSSKTTV